MKKNPWIEVYILIQNWNCLQIGKCDPYKCSAEQTQPTCVWLFDGPGCPMRPATITATHSWAHAREDD